MKAVKQALKSRAADLASYFYARLSEGSTLRGIVVLVATLLCHSQPESIELIVTIAGVVVGALGVLFPDVLKRPISS